MKRFLWWLAGANIFLLQQCPTDQNKYTKIGLTIFLTGIIAGFTGGFAIYSSFEGSFLVVIAAGIIWGVVILNLDSLIVSSIKDNGTFLEKLRTAWIRILLSVFIGFVIAHPFELYLFNGEIKKQVEKNEIIRREKLELEATTNLEESLKKYEAEKTEISQKIKEFDAQIECYRKLRTYERTGIKGSLPCGSSSGRSGTKERYDELSENINRLNDSRKEFQNQLDIVLLNAQTTKDGINLKREEISPYSKDEKLNILSAHIALMSLMQEEDKEHIFWINLFITLLIIFIELSPVLIKLMQSGGRYDILLLELSQNFSNEEAYWQAMEKYPSIMRIEQNQRIQSLKQQSLFYREVLQEQKAIAQIEHIMIEIDDIHSEQKLEELKSKNRQFLSVQIEDTKYRIQTKMIDLFEQEKIQEIQESKHQDQFAEPNTLQDNTNIQGPSLAGQEGHQTSEDFQFPKVADENLIPVPAAEKIDPQNIVAPLKREGESPPKDLGSPFHEEEELQKPIHETPKAVKISGKSIAKNDSAHNSTITPIETKAESETKLAISAQKPNQWIPTKWAIR